MRFAIGRDPLTDELAVWPYIHAHWAAKPQWRYLEEREGVMLLAGRLRTLEGHDPVVVARCVVHHDSSKHVYAVRTKCVRWNAALAESIVVAEKMDDGLCRADAKTYAQRFIRDRLLPLTT